MSFENVIAETKTNMNLIPSYASMNEAVFYILEDNERNFSQMIRNIGLKELAVYESTGSVLLYEADSEEAKAAAGEKVNFVAKAWANIRAAFEALIKKIVELAKKVGIAIQGAVAKGAAGTAKVATKKKSAEDLKAEVDKLSDDFLKSLKGQYEYKELGAFRPKMSEADTVSSIAKALSNYDYEDDKAVAHSSLDEVKKALGVDEINPETVRKAVRGAEEAITKDAIKSNFEGIYASVTDQKYTTKVLKDYFKNAKGLYDKAAKAAKKSESTKDAMGELKALVQATSCIYSTILAEYYAIIFRNAKIVLKLNALATKSAHAAKKEAKKAEKEADKKGGEAKDVETGEKVQADVVDKDGNVVENATETPAEGEKPVEESTDTIDSEIASLFDWSF